jgi:hypothetical protein
VQVLRFLARLRQLAQKYHDAVDFWEFAGLDRADVGDTAHEAGLAVVSVFENEWSDTQAHAGTSGSADVIRMCSDLEQAMVQFDIHTDPDDPLGWPKTHEDRAVQAKRNADRVIKIASSIRDQINSEQEPA